MSKKSIAFLSVARSDFGRLYPTLCAVNENEGFDLRLIVSGNHNSARFGDSINEIKNSALPISHQIELKSSSMAEISSELTRGLNSWFQNNEVDFFVILGDRYEMLAAAQAAFLNSIPIVHIGGGYKTAGAIDDRIRHAISQLSTYHFTATEKCRERVCSLLGSDEGVFLSGAPDIEILKNVEILSKADFYESCNLAIDKPFALVTVHPETLLTKQQNEENLIEFEAFLDRIEEQILITAPCADPGADLVFAMIERLKEKRTGFSYIQSLGMKRYAAAMKYAEMMIGNSSSGIIESATMGIPVLDVGNRQGGRERNSNVLNSTFDLSDLMQKYETLKSLEFKKMTSECRNIYGDGEFSGHFIRFINSL